MKDNRTAGDSRRKPVGKSSSVENFEGWSAAAQGRRGLRRSCTAQQDGPVVNGLRLFAREAYDGEGGIEYECLLRLKEMRRAFNGDELGHA
ncbi:hypothetical protein HPP92_015737 [Vanilla planifolia]|uniref:Uncharacterized protein n=1 Tax=Vanilla planifolia TaxID=51239 RepID=A0A835UTJ2_VANPL|nr:hypothetical protein HPP92_015737 [Vanilla planifolia]